MATCNLEISRAQRNGVAWWVAYLCIELDDGTPLEFGSALRESDLRDLASRLATTAQAAPEYAAQAVVSGLGPVNVVGSWGGPDVVLQMPGGHGTWTLYHVKSGDLFRSDYYAVTAPVLWPPGDPHASYQPWRSSGDSDTERQTGTTFLRHFVQDVDPVGGVAPSRGAVLAYDSETAQLAGMVVHAPSAQSGTVLVGHDDAARAQQGMADIASAIAQRVASGAVQQSQLDPTHNAVHAAAVQLIPQAQAGTLAPVRLPGGVTVAYTPAPPPPGGAAIATGTLPADAQQDPASGYYYSPSTGQWYDPATHAPTSAPASATPPALPAPSATPSGDLPGDPLGACAYYGAMFGVDGATFSYYAQAYGTNCTGLAYALAYYYQAAYQASQAPETTAWDPAAEWGYYQGGAVQGCTVGDLWDDIGNDIKQAASALLGNDVVSKALAVATPILTMVQPEIGLALGAGQAAAQAVLSGAASPHDAAAAIVSAESSGDALDAAAARVLRALLGAA